jgi:hypothetical protein
MAIQMLADWFFGGEKTFRQYVIRRKIDSKANKDVGRPKSDLTMLGLAMPYAIGRNIFIRMLDEPWLAIAGSRIIFTDTEIISTEDRFMYQQQLVDRFMEPSTSRAQPAQAKGIQADLILAMAIMCTSDLGAKLHNFVMDNRKSLPEWCERVNASATKLTQKAGYPISASR